MKLSALVMLALIFSGCESNNPTFDKQMCKLEDGRVIEIEWYLGDRYRIIHHKQIDIGRISKYKDEG